jgi:hypothetical protein
MAPGMLTVRGCVIQASGTAPREFLLPLLTDEEEEKRTRVRIALECETGRFKYPGLESRPWGAAGQRFKLEGTMPPTRATPFLECKVVPEQPLLRIRRTSLIHGALMLYNGEM